MGMRGAHVTVGPRGVRRTVGIPGSGVYYTEATGLHTGVHSAHVDGPVSRAMNVIVDVVAQVVGTIIVGVIVIALLRACVGGT